MNLQSQSDPRAAVKEKIAAFLRVPASQLSDEMPLARLVTDSFMIVELLVDLQEELAVHLHQEELKNVVTLGDLTSLVVARAAVPAARQPQTMAGGA